MESVILDFEEQLKEAVNEEHEGKRKCELTWKVHRIHWEKNRFIFDIMYKRKAISRELVSSSMPCILHVHTHKEKKRASKRVNSTPSCTSQFPSNLVMCSGKLQSIKSVLTPRFGFIDVKQSSY